MMEEDDKMNERHCTFETYNAHARGEVDGKIVQAVDNDDTILQAAITQDAAGHDPVLPPPPAWNQPCTGKGIAWLERMKEQDERIKAAIQRNDHGS